MSIDAITEYGIEIREATTRYINISCKSKETGMPFDFSGFAVQTFLKFDKPAMPVSQYVPTAIVDSMISYKIPADISLGAIRGVAETRIFKNGDVYEVLRINVAIKKAAKPDIATVIG